MRNHEPVETPLHQYERNPFFLLLIAVFTVLFAWPAYRLLVDVNPWGFLMMIPAAATAFQLLWLSLNPFAMLFENKFEIRQSFVHQKQRYFVDIKKVKLHKNSLMITYNDDETEKLSLWGIKASDAKLLKEEVEKNVLHSLGTRP